MGTVRMTGIAATKPRVYKISKGGCWWADVVINHTYYCELFFNHANALAKAYEYARMSEEATK